VSVVLELARLSSVGQTKLPVVFVAFAAEEPRGEGDALHHFGSTAMVDRLSGAERRATNAMVALDRIGVGTVVPVCTGGLEPPSVRAALLRAAGRIGVPASACLNTSSDHWSFEKAGMRAARVGGTSYAGYHSAGDVPSVIDPAQVQRVGRLMWGWLRG
jgi:Zn-dependent M28 family amino/carboxypeptidase